MARAEPPYRPVILHADMDAFYASVEQRDRPELRGRPVIVGGTSGRGVVTAASYEARPLRRPLGDADGAGARALPRGGRSLPGDMAKYRRVSAQIRTRLRERQPAGRAAVARRGLHRRDRVGARCSGRRSRSGGSLRERVRAATGLAVSVGIGPGKMIAKIASDLAKPDGLLEVPPDAVRGVPRVRCPSGGCGASGR